MSPLSQAWGCELSRNYNPKALSPYTSSVLKQLNLTTSISSVAPDLVFSGSTDFPEKKLLHALYEIEPYLSNCEAKIEDLLGEIKIISNQYREIAAVAADFKIIAGKNLSSEDRYLLEKTMDTIREKTPIAREKLNAPRVIELKIHHQKPPNSRYVIYHSSDFNKITFDVYLKQIKLNNFESIVHFVRMLNSLYMELPLRFRRKVPAEFLAEATTILDSVTFRFMRRTTLNLLIATLILGLIITLYRRILFK